ncbi:MAG: AfsR/SARP family transcriptional regulator [Roseiflexus sp.]
MTHPNHSSAGRAKSRKGEKPGWYSYRQALVLLQQREWDGALRRLAEAEVIFRTTNDLDGQWRALAAQAEIHIHEGMTPQAMARALAAMAIVEHLDDPQTCGLLAWRIALIALHQGDYRTGSTYLQRAQFCLDMANAAPQGGILASAAQICAEIARWQQVILQGRMTPEEGEAIINEAHAELMRCLVDIHRALTSHNLGLLEAWAWMHAGLLPPPPPLLTAAPPRSLVQRFLAWWQALFATHASPKHPVVVEPIGVEETYAGDEAIDQLETVVQREDIANECVAATAAHIPDAQEQDRSTADTANDTATTAGIAGLTVYTFGNLRVYFNDTPIEQWEGVRSRSLFRFLIAHRHTPVTKERLAALFWPDSEPDLARRSLHQAVYCLRQTFKRVMGETPVVLFVNGCYALSSDLSLWVDADAFEESITIARSAWSRGDVESVMQAYGRAIDLYQGDYMAEERYEDWAEERRRAFQFAYLEALHQLARVYQERGDYSTAIMLSQRALAVDSCDEDAHRMLIGCYASQGLRHLAVRQYQICVATLKSQFGLSPSDELEAFIRQVLEGMN